MGRLIEHSGIDTDIFTTNMASGGTGGTPFALVFIDQGAFMTRIKVWKQGWRIRGVEMGMSDNQTHYVGTRSGDSSEFVFQEGEKLRELNVQASGETSTGGYYRLGAISFKTTKGRSWGIYSKNLDEAGKYWPPVGEGMVCGMFGAGGADVDRLGFAILQPVEYTRLVEIIYPTLDMEIVATSPESIVDITFSNDSDVEQTFTIKESHTVTTKQEWSISTGLEYALETTVSAGIPLVADVSTSAQWSVSATSTYDISNEETSTTAWEFPITCPPNSTIEATCNMYADEIDTDYEGKVEITFKNGNTYKYNIKGMYSGLNARLGTLEIKDLGPAKCMSQQRSA